jgi:hypothetical protein
MTSAWKDRIEPSGLLSASERLGETEFREKCGHSLLLAVQIRSGHDPLAEALHSAGTGAVPAAVSLLGYKTQLAHTNSIPPRGPSSRPRSPRWPNLDRIKGKLAESRCFLVVLCKRAGADAAFPDRVSVGRARNTDIPLRHSSVSKFHSYFQLDEAGQYYIVDATSTNGTFVNGKRIVSRSPQVIREGDLLTFGSVRGLLLAPDTLWRVVRSPMPGVGS